MIFCHKCGSQEPDDSMFCHKCGTKLVTDDNIGNHNKQSTYNFNTESQREAYTTPQRNTSIYNIIDTNITIPLVKCISCILGVVLIVIELFCMWSCNFVSLGGYGISAGNVISGIISNFNIVIKGLESNFIDSDSKAIYVIIIVFFLGIAASSIKSLISAVSVVIKKDYDHATTEIISSLCSLAFDFGALIVYAYYISNKTYKIVSIGTVPIVCLVLSIVTVIYFVILKITTTVHQSQSTES